jgi:choline-glycine betaine transporter
MDMIKKWFFESSGLTRVLTVCFFLFFCVFCAFSRLNHHGLN